MGVKFGWSRQGYMRPASNINAALIRLLRTSPLCGGNVLESLSRYIGITADRTKNIKTRSVPNFGSDFEPLCMGTDGDR